MLMMNVLPLYIVDVM